MSLRRGELFLGLDVGTQSTKALVIDLASDAIVARAQSAYDLIEGLPRGAAEQHPDTWWDAVRTVIRELGTTLDLGAIRGVGVSGQQHGFVPLDEDRQVLRPAKLWCDTATAAEAEELSQWYGRAVPTGFTASKILWMKRHEPERFGRLRAIALPHDWVNLRLSGRLFSEAGDASGSGFFDPMTRAYRHDDVARIDLRLPDALPTLVAANAVAATLDSAAAQELGLRAGIPIAPGGGDNMMSAIGAGAIEPGVCVVSLGTSGTVFGFTEQAVVDDEGLIAPFCDSTGGYLPLLCTMNVTGVTESVREAFDPRLGHDDLVRAAEAVEPGCGGVLFVPFLQGERVPDLPNATGSLLGLRPDSFRPGVLYRAAIEGTSLNLGQGVDRMRRLGLEVSKVRLVGGGAHNPLWRRVLADVLDAEIQLLEEPESAALGAALQAAWVATTGGDRGDLRSLVERFVRSKGPLIEPDPQTSEFYRGLARRFRDTVEEQFG